MKYNKLAHVQKNCNYFGNTCANQKNLKSKLCTDILLPIRQHFILIEVFVYFLQRHILGQVVKRPSFVGHLNINHS